MSKLVKIPELLRGLWNKLSGDYDKYVIDKSSAYPEARNYENFEEALVLGILKGLADRGKDVAFIEAGSGTGRYMKILGYKITPHKKPVNSVHSYDDNLSRRLKLIVGVDFSEKMIGITHEKLKSLVVEKGITLFDKLVQGDKLRLINDRIENTKEDRILKKNEKDWTRMVCCMFGTFGNISKEAREEALKQMAEWTGSNGVLITSVFNRDKLKDLGYYSYWAVRGLIGVPEFDYDNGDVTTNQGFLSHWYTLEELRELAKTGIDLRYKYIIVGEKLGVQNDTLDTRRGLILVASNEEILWLDDLLRALRGEEVPENAVVGVN